ncbi:hypothetical protein DPEC_G00057810 [Dallia pectoralis]|uniref:Uncharacterized protein n=1 Tax=Dallia pectoralis TaxID=75939 RepID=A0ACC2H687_DALPE|nr:hypothetical protein DPEC_G00057810 [Dallia pectoralis]
MGTDGRRGRGTKPTGVRGDVGTAGENSDQAHVTDGDCRPHATAFGFRPVPVKPAEQQELAGGDGCCCMGRLPPRQLNEKQASSHLLSKICSEASMVPLNIHSNSQPHLPAVPQSSSTSP